MIEREEPAFVKFSTGDVVEGVLESIERAAVQGKPVLRYTVRQDGGEFVQFLGAYQINTKLRMGDRGHRVEIACVGEDTMVKKGDNFMKIFRVRVSRELAEPQDPHGITDEDIPF